jgi:hypothetical protein
MAGLTSALVASGLRVSTDEVLIEVSQQQPISIPMLLYMYKRCAVGVYHVYSCVLLHLAWQAGKLLGVSTARPACGNRLKDALMLI